MSIEVPDLGSCCVCGKHGSDVINILMLPYQAPELGKGWGCVACGLPLNGAVAVLCDKCLNEVRAKKVQLTYVCAGYPGEDRRVLVAMFAKIPFEHRMEFHRHERRHALH